MMAEQLVHIFFPGWQNHDLYPHGVSSSTALYIRGDLEVYVM